MSREIKLIWDFRGPDGLRTAQHHEIHLKDFLKTNNITQYTITGVEIVNEMHSLAFWVIPEIQIPTYRDLLKPHRAAVYTEE